MQDSKFKIYYFFSYGELIESIEEDSPEKAVDEMIKKGYNKKELDCFVQYDKKTGYYQAFYPSRLSTKQLNKLHLANYNKL